MMAAVFFMQPLGQISGNLVSLLVVLGSRNHGNMDLTRSVDIMWRWIVGIGVVPGIIALIFRVAIPETPRFLLDIEDDPIKAEFDTTQLYRESPMQTELEDQSWGESAQASISSEASRSFNGAATPTATVAPSSRATWMLSNPPMTTLNSKWTLSKADIVQYFLKEGNWRTLLATSLCWLLLDFGFYGIGLSNPQFLAKTWGNDTLKIHGPSPTWMTNEDPHASIYTMFMNTSIQALVILNIGSFTGGALLICLSDRLNRVNLQKYGFLFLAAVFLALGTVFVTIQKTGGVAIALYVVGQLAFNFGKCFPRNLRTPFCFWILILLP